MLRKLRYALGIMASTAVVLPALFLIWLSTRLAVSAYRAWPDPSWGNCWTWAAAEWSNRIAEWVEMGMPSGLEPRIECRPSRKQPRIVPHVLLVHPLERWSDVVERSSYKPDAPTDEPLWRVLLHFGFKGSVRFGDIPTQASEPFTRRER